MDQLEMIHETLYDAIRADIQAAGGFKVVAAKLWPADPRGDAKLRNMLNEDQPHVLPPLETLKIIKLAKEHGSTYTVDFQAEDAGYKVTWVDPKDEGDQLRRDFISAVNQVKQIAARIERVDERALKAVK